MPHDLLCVRPLSFGFLHEGDLSSSCFETFDMLQILESDASL